jgi:nucleotide-binding universal stress UspA family protein
MAKEGGVIVVPTDFEDASMKALELAKDLAGRTGGEVVVVHVYSLPVYTYPGLEPALMLGFHSEVMQAARRALAELGSAQGGLRTMLREGDPSTEILAAAAEVSARLIVMGTHGRKGFAHLFLGSVAEKVVRRSAIPVMTVRSP